MSMESFPDPPILSGESRSNGSMAEPVVLPFRREKKAPRIVLLADALADRTITIEGIMVIFAVLGILVFLVAETNTIFTRPKMRQTEDYITGRFG